jgi:hypothetical protein
METQVSRTAEIHEMSDASEVKIKINTLLYGILPGWTTLAEMEMIAAHTFEAVESQWKHKGPNQLPHRDPRP